MNNCKYCGKELKECGIIIGENSKELVWGACSQCDIPKINIATAGPGRKRYIKDIANETIKNMSFVVDHLDIDSTDME